MPAMRITTGFGGEWFGWERTWHMGSGVVVGVVCSRSGSGFGYEAEQTCRLKRDIFSNLVVLGSVTHKVKMRLSPRGLGATVLSGLALAFSATYSCRRLPSPNLQLAAPYALTSLQVPYGVRDSGIGHGRRQFVRTCRRAVSYTHLTLPTKRIV
eukprot:1381709-Amorphochlora_amoeboformis.AAC.2